MKSNTRGIVAVLAFAGLAPFAQAQTAVVDSFVGGGGPFSSFYGTLLPSGDVVGYRFTADEALVITDLGVVDDFDGVLDAAHSVGLWRDSDQVLLASASVSSADTLIAGFWYASITPVTLVAGESYTLGAEYASDDSDSYVSGRSSVVLNGISGVVGVEPGAGDLGFVYPSTTSAGNLGRFGPNALFSDAVAEACCLPDGSCSMLVSDDCLAQGGAPQGTDTDCMTPLCPAQIPTVSEWGLIVLALLMLTAGTIIIRREMVLRAA